MTTSPQLSVVVPVFNERDNVAPLIHEITAALRGRSPADGGDFEIVYVDDHSKDDTLGVLLKYQDDIQRLQGTEAAEILRKVKSDIAAQPLG